MPKASAQINYHLDPRQKKRRQSLLAGALILLIIGGIFAGASQLQVVREFFGQASGVPANIFVDTQAVLGPMPRPWRNLAQGGEDHNWRIGNITSQVAALAPEYIRLDHIYDFYDIVQGQPGNLTYNWEKFDLVIDDILKTGAKPYLALSYMPPVISSGDILAYPQNWSDWQAVIRETIKHVSGTKGISDVYYEVWNEPDLFGSFKYYGDKNYLTLYAYASAGADQAARSGGVRPFKFGGPAITALYENWFKAWAKGCSENNWRCDFFSWHRYTYDLNQYAKDMASVRQWVEDYPVLAPKLEFHITEWGHDSDVHPGYDTVFSAAHTVAGAMAMVGRVERAFAFEIQDGKSPENKANWGRWGLFTHNDFGANAKSRYYGLKFLDSIADERLQCTGDGSWVKALAARNEANNVEVMMANFDGKGRNSEVVPVNFMNIEPGNYTLKKSYLSGKKSEEQLATSAAILRAEVLMTANEVLKLELVKN